MSKQLPPNPSLEYEKKQAKALLKAYRAGDLASLERVRAFHPRLQNVPEQIIPPEAFKLSDAQLVIAREYGLSSWPQLKHTIETRLSGLEETFRKFARAVQGGQSARVRELLVSTPALAQRINDPVIGFDAPAIVIAAGQGREMVSVLLEHGADINSNSVWWAGAFGVLHGADSDMAAYLIERGAKVDVHSAAEQGMLEALRQMIEADPSLVDAKGPDGQRPLHFAHSTEVIDFLLEHGADIHARDVDHCGTAAQWMVGDRPGLCRYLLERGAQADIFMAAALGDSMLATKLLDGDSSLVDKRVGGGDYPAVPPAPGGHIYAYALGDNQSPHQIAHRRGHHQLYQLLLERSSPERRFVAACERGDTETAQKSLANAPNIAHSLPYQDQRLLADAAWENEFAIVQLMLDAGFDPHVRGSDQSTPLDRAAFHGFIEVVDLLLTHNPPLEVRNQYGATPLESAIYGSVHSWRSDGNFPATVKALLKAGATVHQEMLSGSEAVNAVLRRYLNGDSTTDK